MYPLLTNARFRNGLISQCTDSLTRSFWENDFGTWPQRDQRDKPQPVLTRLRAFLSDPLLRNVLGQVNGALDLERIVQNRQIFIADLDRVAIGQESSRLLACLLVSRLQSALESRGSGWPFYIYLPALEQVHVGIGGRVLAGRYAAAGVVAGVNALDGLTAENRGDLLSAETLVSFRLPPDDVRHVAPRFRIPKPDENLTTLTADRLAVSGYLHELKVADSEAKTWNQAASIERRSRNVLAVRRRLVEKKIDRFIDQF